MKTFATKQLAKDSTNQHQHVDRTRSHNISTEMPLLQRQCACGGGCPRCQDNLKLQTKLKISEPGDPYEQEADRIADQVMRMPEPTIQRQMEPYEEEEGMVQREAIINEVKPLQRSSTDQDQPSGVTSIVHKVLNSPGQILDSETQRFMEPRFGQDFNHVRIHTDFNAVASARAINAQAYTVGADLIFDSGRYNPGTEVGRRLLAHELVHTIQQGALGRQNSTIRQIQPTKFDGEPIQRQADAFDQLDDPFGASSETSIVAENPDIGSVALDSSLPSPNRAPACDEVCGEKDKCIQGPGQKCSDDISKMAGEAFKSAAGNLTKAIDHFDNTPASKALTQSLKTNFNWSPGNDPPDLPAQVKKGLDTALTKFSDNLCIKCEPCPANAVAHIVKARGKNCLDFNCYVICPDFEKSHDKVKAHALLHELFHRVASGAVEDLYRGQPGYPGPPSTALKMPDPFASLVDDLVTAGAAPNPAPATKP